jgi:hypothetical protein
MATVDRGTATVAVAVLARLDARWRLLGSTAAPAAVPPEALLRRLGARLRDADPDLARSCGLQDPASVPEVPRLEVETLSPPVMVVVAATDRVVGPLAAVAASAGWRVRSVALEGAEILSVASLLAAPSVSAVLAGTSDPLGADERPLVGELAALVVAAVQRRPDLTLVLAGGIAEPGGRAEAVVVGDRPGATLYAPAAAKADGARLRELLDGLRGGERDGRRAVAVATGTLAAVLRRRVEVVDIGYGAGTRAAASWSPDGAAPEVIAATVADAALVPPGVDDTVVDGAAGWLTVPLDRLRVRDRLRELALIPWGDAAGDGARLRMAAARAALARLVAATPMFEARPAPDVVVASGGAWSVAPGPAVALALADVLRRPGVRALGLDHARLLGPLGTIEDEGDRRRMIADLRDELLVPLGSVVMPGGMRTGRPAGRVAVQAAGGPVELDLIPGGLELVDLPPGERAVLDLRFRDPVDLGQRARHFAVEVAGGLGGVLVDLRDVPLRLPERQDPRRELLATWEAALWTGTDA